MEYYSQRYLCCSSSLSWSRQETQSPVSESETKDPEHTMHTPMPATAPCTYPGSLQECRGAALVRCLGSLVRLENSHCFLDLTTESTRRGEVELLQCRSALHKKCNIPGPDLASAHTHFQEVKDFNNNKIQVCCFCRRLISPKISSASSLGKCWGISPFL